ncbi:hypothetical protein PRK78_002993 [Emydomyces testavorans]|uniref:Exosome complex protein n=1 Tax=Emydomyces testavorans TaxID=2070801 RepID=A0AAF0DFA0_9EURO|nr:hypothetical protein PRK78_002993 [Emydomyces testavorans]
MEMTDLMPLVDQLEGDIDELEEVLEPLLEQAFSATTQKMTVMDKAKLHVLITYTIESLLFSYLRLQGVNAREHPVFKELTRVKQYFTKIKDLETVPEKPKMAIDKQAAARFIKHGLAGNDKIDLERAEREAKERAMAQLRSAQFARRRAAAAAAPAAVVTSVPQNRSTDNEEDEELDNEDDDDTENDAGANPNVEEKHQAESATKMDNEAETLRENNKKRRKAEREKQRLLKREKKYLKKLKKQRG